ncbi:MAG TPA: PAS domain-containing protein [Burkholderiales bacterium]|nr:PAS domain-containing protein [Burkholderiales bacterium]
MRRWIPYLVALVAVGAALALRAAFDPWLGDRVPYITVFGAVIVAAWFGGPGPALVAAVVGWLCSDILFTEPRGALAYPGPRQIAELIGYAISSLLIAALGGAMHRARRRSEESEQRFRAFMQNWPNGVFLKDEEGRYLFMNRAGERLAGSTGWLGKTDEELIGGRVGAEIRDHDRAVLEKDEPRLYDLAFPAPDGMRTLRSVKFPLRDASGRRYVGSITTDVTEQVHSDAAVREAQHKLQTVADALPAAVTLCSRDLRYLWINRLGAQWLRRTPQEVIGRRMEDVMGAEQLARIRPYIDHVLAGEEVSYEREVDYPGIGRRWVSVRFAPAGDGWVAVITDIHERKGMEQALREADRRKDQFIATLAHELRNPLAPIRSAVEIQARADASEADRAWSRGVIERQVAHMSRLIDDLLDMARISRGKLLLRRERVTIAAVAAAALETSRPAIDAGGHRLVTRMSAADAVLEADPTRLAQVLSNLLNNAAKYTAPGGVIELHADQVGGEAVIAVLDNGMGFPPEVARELFEPFAQWAPAAQSAAGLGIGLSLVRGIVELHGGTISAASEGPGRGSRFEVRLPLAAAAEAPAPGAPAAEPVAPRGIRVMIADDNRDAADSLCRILALYGYEARAAYDGASAIELCESFQPHVAVLDIGMPVRNGYDVARHLRARRGRDLRLIALTGWGGDGDVQRAREAGFDGHLTKPVDPGTLNEMISRASA